MDGRAMSLTARTTWSHVFRTVTLSAEASPAMASAVGRHGSDYISCFPDLVSCTTLLVAAEVTRHCSDHALLPPRSTGNPQIAAATPPDVQAAHEVEAAVLLLM